MSFDIYEAFCNLSAAFGRPAEKQTRYRQSVK